MPLPYTIRDTYLDNGMRVVVQTDEVSPNVAVNLWVGVGSRHENAGGTGFAHLFEHLMFQGSQNVAGGEHFAALMAEGARLNATTSFDRTNYFEVVPRGALELALWLEADRHGGLLPALTQESFDNQRDVVKEEKRQRYDNVPYGNWLADVFSLAFPARHPYSHIPIGSMADLDAAALEDAHAFYTTHYRPSNTVLTMAGKVGVDEGFALAERYFGHLTDPRDIPLPQRGDAPALDPITSPLERIVTAEVPHERIYMAFRLPGMREERESLAAALALDTLGGLSVSRLERSLVRGSEIATSVSAFAVGLVENTSLGLLVAEVADGVDGRLVEEAVCVELDRLTETGPTAAELEAGNAQNERAWLSALASLPERADQISEFTMLLDRPGGITTYLDTLAEIGAEDVTRAARAWLRPESRATCRYLPERPTP